MDVLTILMNFWVITLILFVTLYFGYFILIFLLAKIKGKKPRKVENFTPFVSILIPCYNVGSVIDYKIQNTLEIDYPDDKFEIIVVESGSTDDTLSRLLRYAEQGKIKLIKQPRRLGKSSAINRGIAECKGEIIVLTDADARVERNAVRELVKNFADPEVGAAVADVQIISGRTLASRMNQLFYNYFRRKPRLWESDVDSVSFCSGHLLGFYKSIIERIDEDIINDDRYILLKTRSRGYRCICDPLSHVYEADTGKFSSQIKQKSRTTTGAIQGTIRFKNLLFNLKYGFFGAIILPFSFLRIIFIPFLLLLLEIFFPIIIWFFCSSYWVFCIAITIILLLVFSKQSLHMIFSLFYGLIVQVAVIIGIVNYILKKYSALWPRVGSAWDEMVWKHEQKNTKSA
ncbi:MAG: glycosyltransferase [Candidatus Heimdallarchaeaceae archaeon]